MADCEAEGVRARPHRCGLRVAFGAGGGDPGAFVGALAGIEPRSS